MRRFALILLIPLTLCAQPGAIGGRGGRGGANPSQTTGPSIPAPPPTPTADLATLEGQVVNAIGGTPLRKATLTLDRVNNTPNASGIRSNYSATTDATGHFVITGIEPGRYRLNATRVGFLSMGYNAHRPGGNSTPMDFDRAQKRSVQFKLTPHGVVSGKITDEDGDPLQSAQVLLMGQVYNQGRREFQQSGSAVTNDLGDYRISGVVPGKYYISARRNPGTIAPSARASQEQEDFVLTYYPNATDISAAAPVEMGPGDQVDGLNFHLAKVRTVQVKGRVVNNAPQPAPLRNQQVTGDNGEVINVSVPVNFNIQVRLIPRNNPGVAPLLNTTVRADGTFEFPSVPPGSYTLIATTFQGNKSHSNRLSLDVGSNNIEGLSLSINPGVAIAGHVHYDPDPTQTLLSLMISLLPKDNLVGAPPPPAAKVDAEGNFRFDDVDAELYNVTVNPLPQSLYLKAIRAGNTDVLLSGLDVGNGAGSLDILVGTNPPQVTGSVINAETQQPAPAVTVVVIPQEKERKGQTFFYSTTSTDQYGNFTFNRLSPGDYKVYAWEDIQFGRYYDPDFMNEYESKGESVTAKEATPVNVKLTMIPAK